MKSAQFPAKNDDQMMPRTAIRRGSNYVLMDLEARKSAGAVGLYWKGDFIGSMASASTGWQVLPTPRPGEGKLLSRAPNFNEGVRLLLQLYTMRKTDRIAYYEGRV
jgi:hypothetical protein